MQGTSGTFSVFGTDFLLPPTEHNWVGQESLGDSGEGRPIYPSVRSYELRWDLMDMASFSQLDGFFETVRTSGSLVVDLPKWRTAPYQFYSYSGCMMLEPTFGKFYEEHVGDVLVVFQKVKTT